MPRQEHEDLPGQLDLIDWLDGKASSEALVVKRTLLRKSEHSIQSQLFAELAYKKRPGVYIIAIPNGGLRHARVALQLKDEGVTPGAPDIIVALPEGRTGWLEMKNKTGRLSDVQIGVSSILKHLGHYWGMARTVDEALAHLRGWGALKEGC